MINYTVGKAHRYLYGDIITLDVRFDKHIKNQHLYISELVNRHLSNKPLLYNLEVTLHDAVLDKLIIDVDNTLVYLSGKTIIDKVYISTLSSNVNIKQSIVDKYFQRQQYIEEQSIKNISNKSKEYLKMFNL